MKILFLSFYFEPDLCAGSFRNSPLFYAMLERLNCDDFIHVITTVPNRYKTYEIDSKLVEEGENYRIDRIVIPKHSGGMLDQAISFSVYYKSVLKKIEHKKYDLVYASSSRLFTAFLGRRCAIKNKCNLYLDIRDIFVDTMKDVFQNKRMFQIPIIRILKLIERYTFKNATHINLVSEGFKGYFEKYKKPTYSFYTNGIDDIFLNACTPTVGMQTPPYIITYAGNIGSGQGLEKIIPDAAKLLGDKYQFRIIGDGGTKAILLDRLKELDVKNVEVVNPVAREKLIELYNRSTFLFFHLNDLDAFKKVLPSKMFEYGAFDKPIVAGVGGYAAQFVSQNLSNCILFQPTDAISLVEQLQKYLLVFEDRQNFKERYSRMNIIHKMVDSILKVGRKH